MSLIPELFIQEYDAAINHLAQTSKYKFAGSVREESVNSERKFYNTLAASTARAVTDRVGATTFQVEDFTKRALTITPFDTCNVIDENDVKYMTSNPLTAFTESQNMALNRKKNEILISAALGTAYTGKLGTSAVTLPASQKIAVNFTGATPANTGLTLAKVLEAKYILDQANDDDMEERFLVISPKQLTDMLRDELKISSSDYVQVQALIRGETDMFAGFKWIKSNQLEVDGSNYRKCFAFVKSGLVFGTNGGISTKVDVRADLNHAIQVRSVLLGGATRLDEKKVVEILAQEV